MRLLALALLLLLAAPAGAVDFRSTTDFGGAIVSSPIVGCCSGSSCVPGSGTSYQRWTPARIAACDGCLVHHGGAESTWGLLRQWAFEDYAPRTDSCFATLRASGDLSAVEELAYLHAVDALVPAGKRGPIWVADARFDLLTRDDLSLGGGFAVTPSMVLHTDRDYDTFKAWFDSAHSAADTTLCTDGTWKCQWTECRSPQTGAGSVAGEKWNAGSPTDCNVNEAGRLITDMLDAIDPELASGGADGIGSAVRYSFGRETITYYAPHVLADRLDPDYQALALAKAKKILAQGWDAVNLSQKPNFYVSTYALVEAWPDIGDGLGGIAGCDTISEFGGPNGCGPFSGPPKRADGSAYTWQDDVLGQVQLARAFVAAGIPFVRWVHPISWTGCPKSSSSWDSDYDDAACDNATLDDPGSAAEEDAYEREIAQLATYVMIDLGGTAANSANIGSGVGSGFSYKELKSLLENPRAGVHVPNVVGWFNTDRSGLTYATAPELIDTALETNPASTIADPVDQPQIPRDAFAVVGQSQHVNNSTVDQDDQASTWRITSPTPLGLISRAFRNQVNDAGALEKWTDANDWPCRDDQCIVEVGAGCAARTAATHPDPSGPDQCVCSCGTVGETSYGVEGGSPWPAMARRWMEAKGRELDFVTTAQGDTCLVSNEGGSVEPLWSPTAQTCTMTPDSTFDLPGDLFCESKRAIANSAVGTTLRAILWSQGECDGAQSVSASAYKAALLAMADDYWSAYGVPMLVAPLRLSSVSRPAGSCSAPTAPFLAIRTAQLEAIDEHAHIYAGPSMDAIEYEDDCTHVRDKEQLGHRWAESVQASGLIDALP